MELIIMNIQVYNYNKPSILNKYKSRLNSVQRKELFQLAYEGRSEKEIIKVETDLGYLSKE